MPDNRYNTFNISTLQQQPETKICICSKTENEPEQFWPISHNQRLTTLSQEVHDSIKVHRSVDVSQLLGHIEG